MRLNLSQAMTSQTVLGMSWHCIVSLTLMVMDSHLTSIGTHLMRHAQFTVNEDSMVHFHGWMRGQGPMLMSMEFLFPDSMPSWNILNCHWRRIYRHASR